LASQSRTAEHGQKFASLHPTTPLLDASEGARGKQGITRETADRNSGCFRLR
jgi:hypothetical protein